MNAKFIKWLSEPSQFNFVNSAPTTAEREKRKAELKRRFDQSNFSGSANFSADADNKADFTATDFSRDEETCFKELNPVEKIKRICFSEEARIQATGYAKKRNEQIRKAKESMRGRRFGFTYYDTKSN